jgi:hypothetical protein
MSTEPDGRSRTPAFCPHRSVGFPGGAPALPKPSQQTAIYPAAVAGHSLPDALRRLDLSGSRGAFGRASRIAPVVGPFEGARLHDPVSFFVGSENSFSLSRWFQLRWLGWSNPSRPSAEGIHNLPLAVPIPSTAPREERVEILVSESMRVFRDRLKSHEIHHVDDADAKARQAFAE